MKHYFCIDMVLFFFYLKEIAKLSWAYKLASATEGPKKKKKREPTSQIISGLPKRIENAEF